MKIKISKSTCIQSNQLIGVITILLFVLLKIKNPTSMQDSTRERAPYQEKKARPDYISFIQQNLKLMKSEADEFLKKGNKELPPITKARHYLYLNFLKQNLAFSELATQDKMTSFIKLEEENDRKCQTLIPQKSYSKRKNNSKCPYSSADRTPEQTSSVVFVKRDKKQAISINQQKINPESGQFASRSNESYQTTEKNRSKKDIKASITAVSERDPSTRYSLSLSENKINKNMIKLRLTQEMSGTIIKNLHLEEFPFRFLKEKHSSIEKSFETTYSSLKRSNQNQEVNEISYSTKKSPKESNKFKQKKCLFSQKLVIKQKKKTINHYSFDKNLRSRTKKLVEHKNHDANSVLDNIFTLTKNIINEKPEPVKKQSQSQFHELLSSDSIEILKQSVQLTRKEPLNSVSSLQFNPLRSETLLGDSQSKETIQINKLKHSHEIPKIIDNLPPKYKKKWLQELEVQYEKLHHLRYSTLDQLPESTSKHQGKNYYISKRSTMCSKNKSTQFIESKRDKSNQKQNKPSGWQPWNQYQTNQSIQIYDFQQAIQAQ